jgi:diaminopimelate epimerase
MMGSPEATFIGQKIEALGKEFVGSAVCMGNPHLVILTDDVDKVDLERLGPVLECHSLFPFRTNVHFVQILDKNHLKQRTWERGAGITLACGSGTCAGAVVAHLQGGADRLVKVDLPGGQLTIDYKESGDIFKEGPAERVFEGDWLPELVRA